MHLVARIQVVAALPIVLLGICPLALGQVDPYSRNLLQIGYDQPIGSQGPQAIYVYYYYNNPALISTNTALRLAIAPAYLDGEIGFRQLLSRSTDMGIGLYGGAFGDNFYEVRQGDYHRSQSFYGSGGGTALSIYQRLNPGRLIPLNLVTRGGFRFSTFSPTRDTADDFEVPDNRPMPFARAGLRFGGKEPMLYPDLGLEISCWFERQWRLDAGTYGFDNDRQMEAVSDLYWAFAGMDYSWTNVGHRIAFAATTGGSSNPDRFSAWRLGGVLPLVAEFPLILPGYYYQEITARRFLHLYASYLFPLCPEGRFQFRVESATALVDYLPGFEQSHRWQTGVGCGLMFTPKNKVCRIVLRYGYGFNAIREGQEGGHSLGLLVQFDFEQYRNWRRRTK